MAEYKNGLIVLSGCPGCEIAKLFVADNPESAEEMIIQYRNQFGEDYYLELIRKGFNEQIEDDYSKFLLDMGEKYGIKVVATNDVHRCEEVDIKKLEKLVEKANMRWKAEYLPFPTDDWLKSEEEMLSRFPDCLEAISTTEEILNKIKTFDVPQWTVQSPRWDYYFKSLEDCTKLIK